MSLPRQRLPDRRQGELTDFTFRGVRHTATIGRGGDGRIAELFIDCARLSSAMADDAHDGAVVVSIALQYGAPLATIAAALARNDDGSAAGVVAAALDAVLAHESGGAR